METDAPKSDRPKGEPTASRTPIVRKTGLTQSEKYLSGLAEKSFLSLWSYPNTFIDKKLGGKGDGKELCDLLVVCGDHVLIFSDKTVAWPEGDDVKLSWKRWYRRAIEKSVDQIRGAERWIASYPDRIFLDSSCTQRLPIAIPPPESRKVHGIVVALGAGKACKEYFKEGIGSLMIQPDIKGDAHWKPENVKAFTIGDVDPGGSFIHVLDDATLDIALGELDTITDFSSYLEKRANLTRSGILAMAGGEEDLLAYFMTHMNEQGEHDFTAEDGSSLKQDDRVSFFPGLYAEMKLNPQYIGKKNADKLSYVWDHLIERFTTHILAGTSVVREGDTFNMADVELSVRLMAAVPRHVRRYYGGGILDALEKGKLAERFTRAFLPHPSDKDQDTGYFFMTLGYPKFELEGGYEEYREVRRNLLEVYSFSFLNRYRKLKQIVGIACEPPNQISPEGSSEDLMVVMPPEWTVEFLAQLEEYQKALEVTQPDTLTEYPIHGEEFPDVSRQQWDHDRSGLNRNRRRAESAKQRRKRKR